MKTIPVIGVLLIFLISFTTVAQKSITHKVWVTLSDNSEVKGTLLQATEEAFVLVKEDLSKMEIDPQRIKTLKIRKTGSVGRGAWMGALGGFLAGSLVGYASGDDEPGLLSWTAEEKAFAGAFLATPAGTLLGIAIGSGKETILVNGNLELYRTNLNQLKRYEPK
jgi:small nuclear ribonucleoprotein (snRNP)-like protein